MRDVVSDMITRIRNGQKANLLEVPLFFPTPKICINILKILENEGFIRGFTKRIINERVHLVVLLKYDNWQAPIIKKIERISKPGQRIFCKSKHLWKINNGLGIFIISTPLGLTTDFTARQYGLGGGEIICYVE